MRNPDRIPQITQLLAEVWAASPDLRLGQLISNAQSAATTFNSSDLFFLEDEYLSEGLERLAVMQRMNAERRKRGAA